MTAPLCECDTCDYVRAGRNPTDVLPLHLWRVRGPSSHDRRPMFFWEILVAARTRAEALSVHPLSTEKWWLEEYGEDWLSSGKESAYESWHLPHDLTCEHVGLAREGLEAKQVVIRW